MKITPTTTAPELPALAVGAASACKMLSIGDRLLFDLVHRGELRPVRIGNGPRARRRFMVSDLEQYLRSRQAAPAGGAQ